MSWTIAASLLGAVVSVLTFFIGRLTAAKSDGERDGAMLSKLDTIVSSVEKIDGRLENLEHRIGGHADRIARLEARMDVYHHGGGDSP